MQYKVPLASASQREKAANVLNRKFTTCSGFERNSSNSRSAVRNNPKSISKDKNSANYIASNQLASKVQVKTTPRREDLPGSEYMAHKTASWAGSSASPMLARQSLNLVKRRSSIQDGSVQREKQPSIRSSTIANKTT